MKIAILLLIVLIIVAQIFIIKFDAYEIKSHSETRRLIDRSHEEEMRYASVLEQKLKELAKDNGINIQFCERYYWGAFNNKLLILEEKINDLEAFLQSRSYQAKDKEDTQ